MLMSGIPLILKKRGIRTKEKLGHVTCSYTSSWEFPLSKVSNDCFLKKFIWKYIKIFFLFFKNYFLYQFIKII
jgi:hypothetical protein